MKWMTIATWSVALPGVEQAERILGLEDGSAEDAVEAVARCVEDDPEEMSVGYGGFPNANGEIELDAAFMSGSDLELGAVAAVQEFPNPVRIARKVMTDSKHNFLVGRGAEEFAVDHGFRTKSLLTEKTRAAWEQKIAEMKRGESGIPGHDTVGVIALDGRGHLAVATSTSGLAMKHRGRVGDTPLVGCGYYVDDDVGGAAATGVGEDIMRGCLCFLAVELMRNGLSPRQAAEEAVRRTNARLGRSGRDVGNLAIICADRQGNHAGACNHEGFSYAAASDECPPEVHSVMPVQRLPG